MQDPAPFVKQPLKNGELNVSNTLCETPYTPKVGEKIYIKWGHDLEKAVVIQPGLVKIKGFTVLHGHILEMAPFRPMYPRTTFFSRLFNRG